MKNLAIITARGGSKRIPRKNIKEFMGKPMLAYAIQAALESRLFDEVMVSTDDNEIAEIAEKYGAKVPFIRSKETANDFATTADVLDEVANEYKKRGIVYDNICCIYPCVPFLSGEILQNAYKKFIESGEDRLTPVVRFSYPIQRALRINSGRLLEFREPEHAKTRSQDLEPMFHDAGMFYFYKSGELNSSKITPYELDETIVQDIDNESDWKMAEMKYRIMKNV